jgi:ABC-type multidrug transport system ATPase subunit
MTTHKPMNQAPKTLTNMAIKYDLQVTGEISYNGYKFNEFVPQKTSAYISQYDLHISEMTVRETLDFSARCQGIGDRAGRLCSSSSRHNHALMKLG